MNINCSVIAFLVVFGIICMDVVLFNLCIYLHKLIKSIKLTRIVTIPLPPSTPINIVKDTVQHYEEILKDCTDEKFVVIPTFN